MLAELLPGGPGALVIQDGADLPHLGPRKASIP